MKNFKIFNDGCYKYDTNNFVVAPLLGDSNCYEDYIPRSPLPNHLVDASLLSMMNMCSKFKQNFIDRMPSLINIRRLLHIPTIMSVGGSAVKQVFANEVDQTADSIKESETYIMVEKQLHSLVTYDHINVMNDDDVYKLQNISL